MSYKVVLTHSFKQSVKRLGKRFRRVKEDVRTAVEALERTPLLVEEHVHDGRQLRALARCRSARA